MTETQIKKMCKLELGCEISDTRKLLKVCKCDVERAELESLLEKLTSELERRANSKRRTPRRPY